MALSNVTQAVQSSFVTALAMFNASDSAACFLWATPGRGAIAHSINWRKHDATEGTETVGSVVAPYGALSASIRSDGRLLVIFDDTVGDSPTPFVWRAVFDYATGEVVARPERLFLGAAPTLLRVGDAGTRWTLTYYERESQLIFIRESEDDGLTWSQRRPVLNNKVRGTQSVAAYAFDDTHVMVAQLGDDAHQFFEIGSIDRTRPLARVVSLAQGRATVIEAMQRTVASTGQLTDTLRAPLISDDAGNIYTADRVRTGTDDGVAEIATYSVMGVIPLLQFSAALPANASPGANAYALSTVDFSSLGAFLNLPPDGKSALVDFALTAANLYIAAYSDVNNSGALIMQPLPSGTPVANFATGIFRAVTTCGCVNGPDVLIAAYTDGTGEHVKIFTENPSGAPTLQGTHRMPSRVNALKLVMSTSTTGTLYVTMTDRLDVYLIDGLDQPIQRAGGWSTIALGTVMETKITSRGNIVAALGAGGVGVFSPTGDRLSQHTLSGVAADFWRPGVAHTVGDLVQPTPNALYAPQRRYFRCTVAGTTPSTEPLWHPTTAVVDGAVQWMEVGVVDAVVTSVAVDERLNRVYACGVVGQATTGRLYILGARGWLL